MKPPSNNSFDTSQEIKELKKIPLKKDFVKKFDNIESAFAKTAKDNNIKDTRGQKLVLNGYKRDNYQRQMASKALKNIDT